MTRSLFLQMLEHNDWANETLVAACAKLDDRTLDAAPDPRLGAWSLRETLRHLADAQRGYLGLLTAAGRSGAAGTSGLEALARSLRESGEGLRAVAQDEASLLAAPEIRTGDGYLVRPWIVLVQAINHAHDHRRQVCGMLRAIGMTPPPVDGWRFGEAVGAVRKAP